MTRWLGLAVIGILAAAAFWVLTARRTAGSAATGGVAGSVGPPDGGVRAAPEPAVASPSLAGMWEPVDTNVAATNYNVPFGATWMLRYSDIQFLPDGTWRATMTGRDFGIPTEMTGTYADLGDGRLRVAFPARNQEWTGTFSLQDDTLTITWAEPEATVTLRRR